MAYSPVTGANNSCAPYFGNAKSGPVKNNGATVMYGGNIQSSYGASQVVPVSQALGNTYYGYRSGSNGTVVPLSPQGYGVSKALSSGTFAQMAAGIYIGMRYSGEKIAGISSTLLAGGAGDSGRKSENSFTGFVRTEAYITTGGWYYDGAPVNRQTRIDSMPTETLPTLAIPGKLTYMVTGITAKVDQYKAKTD